MKTPEEIKKVLKYCLDGTGCCICPYGGGPPDICRGKLFRDVLEYIQRLEKECAARKRLSNRLHKELEAANRKSDMI